MKKFKDWIAQKWKKEKQKRLVPLSKRVKLEQDVFPLQNGRHASVRIATTDDVTDILKIERACYNGETPWNRSALVHEIQYNKNAFYVIMHDRFQPIAFVGSWFVHGEAHITNIATIPEYEQQGIATFLIEQLTDVAYKEEMNVLSLECRVSNKKAQRLYRHVGFVDGKVKKDYYANDKEDALEMAKHLKQPARKEKERDSYAETAR